MFTNNSRESVVVEAVCEPVKKVKKSNKKKVNMNEEAGTYYSEMLVMEKRLSKLKERVLLRKLRVEMLKEKLLLKHLKDEGPEEEDDDDDDEEDNDDEGSVMAREVIVEEGDPGSVRSRGQVERERMMSNMK